MMVSDLEGMLIDAFGISRMTEMLGPNGEEVLDAQFIAEVADDPDARAKLARSLGSKGWQANIKTTGKMEPHLPRMLIEKALAGADPTPVEIERLESWLRSITEGAITSAV